MKDHDRYYDNKTGWAKSYGKLTANADLMRDTVTSEIRKAMTEEYPLGSVVIVTHHRGWYRAIVVGYFPKDSQLQVQNIKSGRQTTVHFGLVNVPEDNE